jgi:cytochrome c1
MELARRTVVTAALSALALAACTGGNDSEAAPPANVAASGGRQDSASAVSANGEAVTPDGATTTPAPAPEGISVMTGVYTREQADRGAQVYATSCGQCHTMGQHSGSRFAAAWHNRKLYDLWYIVRTTMPVDEPGGLSDQEYLDVIAYMLRLNGIPAGTSPLDDNPATLKGLQIEVRPTTGP